MHGCIDKTSRSKCTLKNSCHLLPEEVLRGWSSWLMSTAQAACARGSGAAACMRMIGLLIDSTTCRVCAKHDCRANWHKIVQDRIGMQRGHTASAWLLFSGLPIPFGLMIRSCDNSHAHWSLLLQQLPRTKAAHNAKAFNMAGILIHTLQKRA